MPADPQKPTFGRTLAQASWVLFLVVFAVNIVGNTSGLRALADLLALGLMFAGFGCGVFALFFVRTQGRKGILIPAIIGIILNGLFIVIWLLNFLAAFTRARGG